MYFLGNFLIAVAQVLDIVLSAYTWVIIIAALLTWVRPDPFNPIVRVLYGLTEPVFRPIRNKIGVLGGIDISPLVVILAIMFLRSFLITSLIQLGRSL
ncbi:MAG: YggT family protein [Candidatus Magnetoovum sp. WYHC-5]|nr:YggT family protein [Candidatus Magnetoovum sp. WYHC-5]